MECVIFPLDRYIIFLLWQSLCKFTHLDCGVQIFFFNAKDGLAQYVFFKS